MFFSKALTFQAKQRTGNHRTGGGVGSYEEEWLAGEWPGAGGRINLVVVQLIANQHVP